MLQHERFCPLNIHMSDQITNVASTLEALDPTDRHPVWHALFDLATVANPSNSGILYYSDLHNIFDGTREFEKTRESLNVFGQALDRMILVNDGELGVFTFYDLLYTLNNIGDVKNGPWLGVGVFENQDRSFSGVFPQQCINLYRRSDDYRFAKVLVISEGETCWKTEITTYGDNPFTYSIAGHLDLGYDNVFGAPQPYAYNIKVLITKQYEGRPNDEDHYSVNSFGVMYGYIPADLGPKYL